MTIRLRQETSVGMINEVVWDSRVIVVVVVLKDLASDPLVPTIVPIVVCFAVLSKSTPDSS